MSSIKYMINSLNCNTVLYEWEIIFEGNHDRILDFNTAVTGILFLVPARNMQDEFSA